MDIGMGPGLRRGDTERGVGQNGNAKGSNRSAQPGFFQ
jgi:hypothetical protein